jgi:hypothetical protein
MADTWIAKVHYWEWKTQKNIWLDPIDWQAALQRVMEIIKQGHH